MSWLTSESEWEGYPLFLRRPVYNDIYKFKSKFPYLLRVFQTLEKVRNNGLPEPEYNLSLIDFDEKMSKLFDSKTEGIVFLIETFGSKRGYFYFIAESADYGGKIEKIKRKFNVKLEVNSKLDSEWGFLDKYPIKLY